VTPRPRGRPPLSTGSVRDADPGPGDDRAVVPSVGKALEASLVLLYVALLSTTLYAGVVPDYRATAGEELADRTLATAAHEVRAAVPPAATAARAEHRVDLPDTVAGDGYRVRATNGTLVFDHPDRSIGGRARLALPDHVRRVEGEWHSQLPARVVVVPAADGDGVVVRLERGETEGGDGE